MFQRLKADLLEKDATSCLPSSLSNEWLEYLFASAEGILDDSSLEDEGRVGGKACIAVVLHLVQRKAGADPILLKVSDEALFEYVQMFMVELGLEIVHRQTKVKYEPATLETLFTERNAATWIDDGTSAQ
jgi:hypothetical protein